MRGGSPLSPSCPISLRHEWEPARAYPGLPLCEGYPTGGYPLSQPPLQAPSRRIGRRGLSGAIHPLPLPGGSRGWLAVPKSPIPSPEVPGSTSCRGGGLPGPYSLSPLARGNPGGFPPLSSTFPSLLRDMTGSATCQGGSCGGQTAGCHVIRPPIQRHAHPVRRRPPTRQGRSRCTARVRRRDQPLSTKAGAVVDFTPATA